MTHRTRVIFYVIGAVALVLVAWVLVHGLTDRVAKAEDHADAAATAATTNGQTAAQAKKVAQTLARQLKQHGLTPTVDPNDLPGPTKVTGPAGAQGATGPSPSRAQVFAAVAAFCSSGACEHGPSETQVETAVETYCAPRNDCRGAQGGVGPIGAPGALGPQGGPGANGTNGADGANVTDAQVAVAVSAYCDAHGQCQGPQGPQGDPGPQGPKGDTGSAQPGTYGCPADTPFVSGFTIAGDGTVTLDCVGVLGGPGPG